MKKPVLVIMAAGMGSRYGGLKQIDPIDEQGHIIIDYSIYDAKQAGFEKVIFIIKKENEESFRQVIGDRISAWIEVQYVYQELERLPKGFPVPEGRIKPWGTAHAVLCCRDVIDGPFAVINADDYYGQKGYQLIYDYLVTHDAKDCDQYAMVGYQVENTLSDHGSVARGICETDPIGNLVKIVERTQIEKKGSQAAYTLDGGATWEKIPQKTIVSMNLFGFSQSIFTELEQRFTEFLTEQLKSNPLKCEYFIPSVVDGLIQSGKAQVQVLHTEDKWYGVTYKEDKATISAAMEAMMKAGLYPGDLWRGR